MMDSVLEWNNKYICTSRRCYVPAAGKEKTWLGTVRRSRPPTFPADCSEEARKICPETCGSDDVRYLFAKYRRSNTLPLAYTSEVITLFLVHTAVVSQNGFIFVATVPFLTSSMVFVQQEPLLPL